MSSTGAVAFSNIDTEDALAAWALTSPGFVDVKIKRDVDIRYRQRS